MNEIIIVAIVFGTMLAGVAIIAVTVVLLRIFGKSTSKAQQAEEARLIQQIFHGLNKMEQRVESLETILIEHEKKEDKS